MTPIDKFYGLPAEEKIQFQLERLQSTLNRAIRHVPFHRKRLNACGMEPADIEAVSDIRRLPFMDRNDLSDHYPYDLFAVPLRDIVRIHTAPGTTTNPIVSGFTAQDIATWRRVTGRALAEAGITAHDIVHIRLSPGLANWSRAYKDGSEHLGASVIPDIRLSVEKQVMVLRDYKASILVTTPAAAVHMVDYVCKAGINPAGLALSGVILAGEAAGEDIRRNIEEMLGVSVWRHYGLSGIPGPAIAFECSRHNGLHVNEDHFFAEIINPETGEVLETGQWGELVLTTLTTRAFPLIRFRTGDRARRLSGECGCRLPLTRIEWAGDRTDGMLNMDGVNVSPDQIRTQVESALGVSASGVGHAVRVADGSRVLEVSIPVGDKIFSDEIKSLEKTIRAAETRLSGNMGIPVVIHLKEAGR